MLIHRLCQRQPDLEIAEAHLHSFANPFNFIRLMLFCKCRYHTLFLFRKILFYKNAG